MKKCKYLIFLLIINISESCHCQKYAIESIKIKYVDFLIMTDADVNCQDFESEFKYKTIDILDQCVIDSIQYYISHFKSDTNNMKTPDTRAKIIISYTSKKKDTICISNFRICHNGIPIVNDIGFTNYIKYLISNREDVSSDKIKRQRYQIN